MRSRSGSTFRRTVGVVLAAFSVLAASSGAGAIQIDPGDDVFVFAEDSNTQLLDVLANDPEFSSIVAYDAAGTLGGIIGEAREGGEITLLTYKPAADAFGDDQFTYTTTTSPGGEETIRTVTVTLTPVEDAPVADGDGISLAEDSPATDVTTTLLANDSDVDSEVFTIVAVTAASNGMVALVQGSVAYTPNADFFGDDSFTYTIADDSVPANESEPATVSVTVTPVDDTPDALPDTAEVAEGGVVSIDVLANENAADIDDSSLNTITAVGAATHGTTEIVNGKIEYTHNGSETPREDSFSYTINGGDPETESSAIVTVTITDVNDDPVAVDDGPVSFVENGDPISINVVGNDTDVDGHTPVGGGATVTGVDPFAVVSVTAPVSATDPELVIGSVAIDGATGEIVYTHTGDMLGDVEFTYTLAGDPGSTATVSLTVTNGDDDAPDVAVPELVVVDEDALVPASVEILTAGQTDSDGSLLSIVEVSDGTLGTTTFVDGTVEYTPNENANGQDSFTVVITDNNDSEALDDVTITVNVNITAVNDAPVADDDSYTVNEDSVSLLDVLVGDTDVDEDILSIAGVSELDAAIGTLAIVGTSVEFTPVENYFGDFTFTYDVNDGTPGEAGTDSASVSVTVRNLEDPLIANPDTANVEEDNVVTVDVVANDVDVDKTGFELVEVEQPDGGFAAITGDGVRVQPDPNFSGTLVVPYGIKALAPVETNSCSDFPSVPGCEIVWGTLTVEVGAVNDRPDANQDTAETDEDTPVTIDVLANDVDSDGDALSIDRFGNTQIGTVEIVDNKLVYTPDPDLNGTDSFIYYVTDGSLLSVALVTVEVAPINDDPTIVSEDLETEEDVPVTFIVDVADIDSETLTVTELFAPDSGAVSIDGTSITYTPRENFFGSDTFVLEVADGDGGFAETFFNVEVAAVNDFPVADDLALDGVEDTPVSGAVVASDVEDTDAAAMSYVVTTEPGHGSVVMTGAGFEYTPEQDYNGADSFVVTVTDTDELDPGTDVATVSILLEAVNDAPTITGPELVTTDEDTAVSFEVVPADIDSETLTVSPVEETAVEGGTFVAVGNEITFTPTDNWFGETSIEVTVTDGEFPVSVIVPINVTSVNDLPVGPADEDLAYSGVEDNPMGSGFLPVSDVEDGSLHSHVVTTPPEHGVVTWGAPDFGYTPEENFNGEDSFVVTVTDSDGGELEMTVSIFLAAVNDAPTITGPELVTTDEDTPVTFTVDVADVDSETLTVSVVEDSAVRGVATVDNKYEVTFVPDPDWHGDSAVDVIVSDGDLTSEALTVPILVTSVNDHPVLTVPAFELDEDSETTVTVNVTDVEDDWAERVLDVEITSGPGKGTLEADGKTFTYTGNADANGSDTFLLSVTDFDGAVAEVLVPVLINPVNDVPTHAQCDDVSVETGSEIAIDVALCGADIDGDVLTVADDAMVSNNGTAVIEDGMIVFAPADGYIGRTAVGFFLTDGTDSVETSIAIQVTEKVNPYIGTAGKDGQLVRIYSAMLGRLPDSKGFTYWSGQLEDGMTVQQLIRYFGTSDEFLNTYGDRLVSDSDADWIEFVYTEILERPSDAKGRAYWTDQLAGGLSRADMVTFFAESSEYKTQTQTL